MRFIVCAKNRRSGETSVVGARSFLSKDEAIAALGGLDSIGLLGDDELFLVDLDTATPVVLVPTRRIPAESAAVDDAGDTDETPEPVATDSAPEPTAELRDEAVIDEWPFVQSEDESVGAAVVGLDLEALDSDRSEVWWLEVGAESDELEPETPADTVVSSEVAREPEDLREDVVREQTTELRGEAPGDLSEAPREGDYITEALFAETPLEQPSNEETVNEEALGEVDSLLEEVANSETAFETPEDARTLDDVVGDASGLDEAVFRRVDFDAWTCSDCIFIATCDRSGLERPATCASFQWRAE